MLPASTERCHRSVGTGVPLAAATNWAAAPVSTERSSGWVVKLGNVICRIVTTVAALWRLQRCSSTDAAATASDGATPGHWLLLKEPHSGRQHWLQLVWPADARPAHGRISVLSPLGQALLGQLPGATIQLRVLGVQFQFQLQDMLLVRRKPRSQSR